jgi:hypothetical protein
MAAMNFSNPTPVCIVYCGQQADGTVGAQMAMCCGSRYLPLDEIFPQAAKDKMDDIVEESEVDAEAWHHNASCVLLTKIGFPNVEQKLKKTITKLPQYWNVNGK